MIETAQWDKIVEGCREVLAKAKGLKPKEISLPGDKNSPRYIKYALGRDGQLALPKRKGRIRPHRDGGEIDSVNRISILIFQRGLEQLFVAAQTKVKESEAEKGEKVEIQPISGQEVMALQRKAYNQAVRMVEEKRRQHRDAARTRQKVSRRINAGLIPGNSDRSAHAQG